MRFFAVLLFVLCINSNLQAQEGKTIEHTIDSKAFGKERTIYVHLPRKYFQWETDSFMVVYVLDAQSKQYWNMATGNIEYLVNNHKVVPMIAVGIVSDHRGREFVPMPTNGNSFKGEADILRQHIKEEIFPLIAANYRINEGRALVGHSRGGAFITGTLFSEDMDMFDAYLGISPAVQYFDFQVLKAADAHLQKGEAYHKFLYYSHGDVGSLEHEFSQHVTHMDSLLRQYPTPSLVWEWDYFPNTDHWSVVAPSWNYGLLRMSRHFGVDQKLIEDFAKNKEQPIKDQVSRYYETKILDFSVPPAMRLLNYYGSEFDEMGMLEEALQMYDWVLDLDPHFVRAHRSKGWLFERQKQFNKAIAAHEAALASLEVKKGEMDAEQYGYDKKYIKEDIEDARAASKK